jgi:hypothetical protein
MRAARRLLRAHTATAAADTGDSFQPRQALLTKEEVEMPADKKSSRGSEPLEPTDIESYDAASSSGRPGGSRTLGNTGTGTGGGGTQQLSLDIQSVLNELQNIGSFPVPGTSYSQPSGYGGGGGGGATSLQRTVELAIQGVLGRLPKRGDHRSFVAALNMSFTYKETETGRRQIEWTPRSYAGQTDLGGGVTGAQASLVTFAQSAYDNSVPLLDGLYSLVDADEQEVNAASAILRSTWTEFINELGKEGGPRAARANALIDSLVNDTVVSPLDGKKGGRITRLGILIGVIDRDANGKLRDSGNAEITLPTQRPRITRVNVVTNEEEVNLTNFIALRDYIFAVQAAWRSYHENFFQQDLGTGLVLLSRLLSVIAEAVDEVYSSLDSVFVGPAERMTIRVKLTGNRQDMSLEELLQWVQSFAMDEAPVLIQEGGRWGVEAIMPTATLLRNLVSQLFNQVERERVLRPQNIGKVTNLEPAVLTRAESAPAGVELPAGVSQTRVLHPLRDLLAHLDELVRTATGIIQ